MLPWFEPEITPSVPIRPVRVGRTSPLSDATANVRAVIEDR